MGISQIAHALILCRMEEGNWVKLLNSDKLDRLRRAHAQKVVNGNPSNGQNNKSKGESLGVPCKYFQSGKCSHKVDHTSNGQLYCHICSHCYSTGKCFSHPLKECRNRCHLEPKKRVRHCRNAVLRTKVLSFQLVGLKLVLPSKSQYRSIIIHNSAVYNGKSTNWQLGSV